MSLDRNWTDEGANERLGYRTFVSGLGNWKTFAIDLLSRNYLWVAGYSKLANMCEIGSILNQVTEIGSHILLKRKSGTVTD